MEDTNDYASYYDVIDKGFQEASKRAMDTMGFVIVAKEGWITKIFKDGKEEKLEKIPDGNGGL